MEPNREYTPNGNSNYIYGQGNTLYNADNNRYSNGQNELNQSEEEHSSFNLLEWVMLFLHYWYLFAIAVAIALGAAMLKNRKWLPMFYSQGTVIIKETSGYSSSQSALMQGFGLDVDYKNINNQVIMLGSYDLMCRVVDSIPFLNTEYITQGRFKTRNLYRQTPITVETTRIDPRAYEVLFEVNFCEDGQLTILSTDDDLPLNLSVRYGEPIDCPLFAGYIMPTDRMVNAGKMHFRFRSRESLVNEFIGRLHLGFVGEGSTVLSLSLTSETPERDREFIDKLAEIYLLKNLEQKNEVAENSIRFINQQLSVLQKSLEVSEGAMTNFRQENKFVDVSSYAGQLMTRVADYDQQTMALRLRETYFDYLTNYLKTNIENGAVIAPTSLGLNEPMLMTLVQQLNELRIQRGELSEKNVYYAKYSKDIENVKTAINEVVSSMRASLEIEKKDLKDRYSDVEREIQNLPTKELQMVAIERNYRIDDNYYTFFLQKRAESEIQKASNTPDNTILDKARTTAVVNASAKRKTTMTYLLIGLLIPFVLIVLSELLNNKVRSPKDLQKMRLFRMIGSVRHAHSTNPTLVSDSPRSSYAEMLRSIRTRIEFIVKRKENIVLVVTSTESGDGKTFLCTNLAALYSMTGKKTLLIDLDLRKPNIHSKLGIESGDGISNYLAGDCKLEDILIHNDNLHFDVLQAGTIPPNPGELIHSDAMTELITRLRQEYAYIIIDTSPIGLVPDAYTLIEHADMCLFAVRTMQTNKSFCKQTLQQMTEVIEDPEKVQLILTDIPSDARHGYGYGYGSNYGYGFGYGYGYGYGYGHAHHHKKKGLQGYLEQFLRFLYGPKRTKNTGYYFDDEYKDNSQE